MERSFIVTLARFHRRDPYIYVVQGYFQGNSIAGSKMYALLDKEELPVRISVREGLAVRQKYFSRGIGYENIDREYDLWITLPEGYESGRSLRVLQELGGKKSCVYRIGIRRMLKEQKMPDGYLETFQETEDTVSVGGWAVGNSDCRIRVSDQKGRKLKSAVTWHYRQDIAENYPELEKEKDPEALRFGYEVTFPKPKAGRVSLTVSTLDQKITYRINLRKGLKGIQGKSTGVFQKAWVYLKRNGLLRTIKRVREKINERMTGREESYMAWRKRFEPAAEELAVQKKSEFFYSPLISIVVPLYRTQPQYLKALIDSVQAQTYANWELCLSDGSGPSSPLKDLLESYAGADGRIRIIDREQQLGIADNTNAALSIAGGAYVAFADHDDTLAPNALYECVRLINEENAPDLIYSDEDKLTMDGREYFEPHFKTDYNIDLLCSMNYFCHLVVVKMTLLEKAGEFRDEFDGAQDYDFVLRCAEKAAKISHIPKVLYHWRAHKDSTSENPASKQYAFEAGMRAVQAHYDRIGVKAVVSMGAYPGLYQTTYLLPDSPPLISIIIPNKDHMDDLEQCIHSIRTRSHYPAYELIVVENNSTDPATFVRYRELEEKVPQLRVCRWEGDFNFSGINNYGVTFAKGDYLLFLNNDTALIADDCLEQLLGPCMRDDVGAVGARLFYEDNTIQHAGVIIGYGGIAGHAFQGFPAEANGYFSRIICQSDLSAVTAACMMVKRSVFEEVGGFDETLKVAFNDIDLCLKIGKAGKLVVYNPFATLYHYESKSRGMEDTPGKIARFNQEADEFLRRWPDILKNGDPYYNPNLSLDANDFRLRK